MIGFVSGKLTVVAPAPPAKNGRSQWECRCECGRTSVVWEKRLKANHTKSCGCSQRHWDRKIEAGQRFGKLTVLAVENPEAVFSKQWASFRCDCGNEKRIRAGDVFRGNSRTCNGCVAFVALTKGTRTCSICKSAKPLSDFTSSNKRTSGVGSWCRECSGGRGRARYREDIVASRAARRACEKSRYEAGVRQSRPPKWQHNVHAAVNRALRRGLLARPGNCERCGAKEDRIEAHHDDYEKPLEVMWLCVACHRVRHQELEREGRDPVELFESKLRSA